MNFVAAISATFMAASAVTSSAAQSSDVSFEVPPRIIDAQMNLNENSCSEDRLKRLMAEDIQRYWNYSGETHEYVSQLSKSVDDTLDMLVAIEADFTEHNASLPISDECNVNYRELRKAMGS